MIKESRVKARRYAAAVRINSLIASQAENAQAASSSIALGRKVSAMAIVYFATA